MTGFHPGIVNTQFLLDASQSHLEKAAEEVLTNQLVLILKSIHVQLKSDNCLKFCVVLYVVKNNFDPFPKKDLIKREFAFFQVWKG